MNQIYSASVYFTGRVRLNEAAVAPFQEVLMS